MGAVTQLTDRAILLSSGRMSSSGPPQSVIELYLAQGNQGRVAEYDTRNRREFHGNGDARIVSLRFNRSTPCFEFNESLSYCISIEAERYISRIRANMTIYARDGSVVGSAIGPEILGLAAGEQREMIVTLPSCRLSPGSYYCAVSIGKGDLFAGFMDFDVVTQTLFFDILPQTDEFGALEEWHPWWGAIHFENLSASWERSVASLSPAPSNFS